MAVKRLHACEAFVESVAEAKGRAGQGGGRGRAPSRPGPAAAGQASLVPRARRYQHNCKPPSSSLDSARPPAPIVCQAPRQVPLGSKQLSTWEGLTSQLVHRCVFRLLLVKTKLRTLGVFNVTAKMTHTVLTQPDETFSIGFP